jgi:cytochrome c peroxidase
LHIGLPPIPQATTDEEVRLGKIGALLFDDPRLSASGKVSCATCHLRAQAFADGRALAIGHDNIVGTRNAPSLLNVAFEKHLFWDGRVQTLEAQALAPLTNPVEHALASEEEVTGIIQRTPLYVAQFGSVPSLKGRKLHARNIAAALAAFQRTLFAGGSPFDLYYYGGRTQALNEPAQRGLNLFRGRGQCARCHRIEATHALFSDGDFHASGRLPEMTVANLSSLTERLVRARMDTAARELLVARDPAIAALGRFIATLDPDDIGKFKTPSLRNVALTAPYMHDGSVATLTDAIDRELYNRTAAGNQPITLTLAERADLLAFLQSLTSPAATH